MIYLMISSTKRHKNGFLVRSFFLSAPKNATIVYLKMADKQVGTGPIEVL
ncbi:hypothetical protein ykris0001_830 [Yersinia kristensenii ATCC 33638]|nr:hypothetical protein ykris0001_830 [Yersinia kristensenii ATCC 33638]